MRWASGSTARSSRSKCCRTARATATRSACRRGAANSSARRLRPHSAQVLAAAQALRDASAGLFDITLGTAPAGWRCDAARLYKLSDAARLDLGGIGKGHAVDVAVDALMQRGCRAGWVNAGG